MAEISTRIGRSTIGKETVCCETFILELNESVRWKMWNGVIRRIPIDDDIAFPESEVSGDYIRQRVVTDAD
jgi:hypothetical protein